MGSYKIADAHCDYLYEAFTNSKPFEPSGTDAPGVTLSGLINGNVKLQVFAAWSGHLMADAERLCLRQMDIYEEILHKYKKFLRPFDGALPEDGTISTVLAIEGGCLSSLNQLEKCCERGAKIISLAWNDSNHLAGGVNDSASRLTHLGKEFIRAMGDRSVLLDVSHLNRQSFADACCFTDKTFIATHSNVQSLCNHPRNLNDEQIKEIIRRKGYIGIAFYPPFLGCGGTIEAVFRHLDYIISMGGEDVAGFGSDFDGIDQFVPHLSGSGDYKTLVDEMEKQGYKEAVIEKICAGNLVRVLSKTV
ncbi:MAG: dipeptidase [Christensenellales bacterium]